MPRLLIVESGGGAFALERGKEMIIGTFVLSVCSTIFSISWFVWPFVFVFSLAWGIRDWIQDECCSAKPLLLAGLALTIMLSGVISLS